MCVCVCVGFCAFTVTGTLHPPHFLISQDTINYFHHKYPSALARPLRNTLIQRKWYKLGVWRELNFDHFLRIQLNSIIQMTWTIFIAYSFLNEPTNDEHAISVRGWSHTTLIWLKLYTLMKINDLQRNRYTCSNVISTSRNGNGWSGSQLQTKIFEMFLNNQKFE